MSIETIYYVKVQNLYGWELKKFTPNEVLPYYDLYDDGSIVIYVEFRTPFLFFWDKTYIVQACDEIIEVREVQIPKRMNCNAK